MSEAPHAVGDKVDLSEDGMQMPHKIQPTLNFSARKTLFHFPVFKDSMHKSKEKFALFCDK
jgi:hypothetical protein